MNNDIKQLNEAYQDIYFKAKQQVQEAPRKRKSLFDSPEAEKEYLRQTYPPRKSFYDNPVVWKKIREQIKDSTLNLEDPKVMSTLVAAYGIGHEEGRTEAMDSGRTDGGQDSGRMHGMGEGTEIIPTPSEIRVAYHAAKQRADLKITDDVAIKAVKIVRARCPRGGVNDDQDFWDEMKDYFSN